MSLKSSRILLANDDGIYAPGLHMLHECIVELCDDVWVVAPLSEQSGAGHSLSMQRPLRIKEIEDRKYSVDGTPTDCVVLGITEVLKDKKPDFVFSGINYGRNVADHVTYSGTVAAAMEAVILGIPSIALSLEVDHKHGYPAWETVIYHLPSILEKVCTQSWDKNVFLNINFPNLPADQVKGVRVVSQGSRRTNRPPLTREDPFGKTYYWIDVFDQRDTNPDTDIASLRDGYITITPLSVNLTHGDSLTFFEEMIHGH